MKKELQLKNDDDFGWLIHHRLNDSFNFFGWLETEKQQTIAYQISIIKNFSFFNIPIYKLVVNLINTNTGTNFVFDNYSFGAKSIISDEGKVRFNKELQITKYPDYFNIDFKNTDFCINIDLYFENNKFVWMYNDEVNLKVGKNKNIKNIFASNSNLKTSGVLRIKGYDFNVNGISFYSRGFGQFSETKIKTHYQKIDMWIENKHYEVKHFIDLIQTKACVIENNDVKNLNIEVSPMDFFVSNKNKYAIKWIVIVEGIEEYYIEAQTQVLSNRYQFGIVKNKEGKNIGKAYIETMPTFYNSNIQSLL